MTNSIKSFQLLSFTKDNNLVYNDSIFTDINEKKRIKVVSIIGDARYGKSTLFNLILTSLTGDNQKTFKTGSTNKHCTNGILSCLYTLKDHENAYLFLDCQGINHEDSSRDIKLLLISYLLSDIIIFNDKSLNNSTLGKMEPIITMESLLPKKSIKKSKLIFRVVDYNLDDPIEQVLKDTLMEHNDQFQNIKKTLKKLFSEIGVCATQKFGGKYDKLLKRKNYKKFLQTEKNDYEYENESDSECSELENDYRFSKTIDYICKTLNENENDLSIDTIKKNIPEWVNSINREKNIKYEVFDTYTNYKKTTINEFWDKEFDKCIYGELKINFTQKYHNQYIQPKLDSIKKFKSKFEKHFTNLSDDIKKTEFEEKIKIQEDRINDIIIKNHNEGLNELNKILENVNFTEELGHISDSFTVKNMYDLSGFYKQRMNLISTYSQNIYNYYNKFISENDIIETAKEDVISNIAEKIKIILKLLYQENNNVFTVMKSYLKNIENDIKKNIFIPDIFDKHITLCLTEIYDPVKFSKLFEKQIKIFMDKNDENVKLIDFDKDMIDIINKINQYDMDDIKMEMYFDVFCILGDCLMEWFKYGEYLNYFYKIVSDYLNSPKVRNLYLQNINNQITNLLKSDKNRIMLNYQKIIECHPDVNKFYKIVWIKDCIYNYENDIFNEEKAIKNQIKKYITIVDKRFTFEMVKDLFTKTDNKNLLVIDFNYSDDNNLKNSVRIHVLDTINKYYINKYIDGFKK